MKSSEEFRKERELAEQRFYNLYRQGETSAIEYASQIEGIEEYVLSKIKSPEVTTTISNNEKLGNFAGVGCMVGLGGAICSAGVLSSYWLERRTKNGRKSDENFKEALEEGLER